MIIHMIPQKTTKASCKLFLMLLGILETWNPLARGSDEEKNIRKLYKFDEYPEDAKFMCDKFRVLFSAIFPWNDRFRRLPERFLLHALDNSPGHFLTDQRDRQFVYTLDALSGNTGLALFRCQRACLKFLTCGAFNDQEMVLPLLLAACSPNADIYQPAQAAFKRLKIDYENPELISTIFSLIADRVILSGRDGTHSDETPGIPAEPRVGLMAIQQVLMKSNIALTYPTYSLLERCFIRSKERKLRLAALQYLRRVCDKADLSSISKFAMCVLTRFKEMITSGDLSGSDADLITIRSQIYEIIGILLSKSPEAMNEIVYIEFLFDSIRKDAPDTRYSLQGALSHVLPALGRLSEESLEGLKSVLFDLLSDPSSDDTSRYIAVRYAVRSMPFEDTTGRLLCLIGMNTANRSDVREEARRGLHPHWYRLTNQSYGQEDVIVKFPDFGALLQQFNEKLLVNKTFADLAPSIFNAAAIFAEQVLTMNAVEGHETVLIIDENWDMRLETAVATDKQVRLLVRSFISKMVSLDETLVLDKYINFLLSGLQTPHAELKNVNDVLFRAVSQMPPEVIVRLVDSVPLLVRLLTGTNQSDARVAAHLVGIIGSSEAIPLHESRNLIIQLLATSSLGQTTAFTLLTASILLARLNLRGRFDECELGEVSQQLLSALQNGIISKSSSIVVECSIDSVIQLALCGFPLSSHFIDQINTNLLLLMKRGNERAVLAYGCLSIIDQSNAESYLKDILAQTTINDVDYMFSSGEALSIIAAGWDSTIFDRFNDIQGVPLCVPVLANPPFSAVVEHALEKSKSTSQLVRKYSCLWLLSLTQYCGHLPECQRYLEHIHLAFMKFLSDKDDLVQESASRGLSMVYQIGDASLKESLLHGLVQSFTSDSRFANSGTVSADTQLFEPGILDTGDGSISTYKDILSLASELGDSSLVYKFMSLARHNTLWATRKGAAFGLGSILAKTNLDDLLKSNPKLGKSLIPKLYRYGFDPNRSVQQSMRGIWDSLVKDRSKTLDDNFDDILNELLKTMSDREWRVRQASALALSDLLQGRQAEQYIDRLAIIWQMSFRIVDDIKDSVRNAGMQLARGLITSSVRQVDVKAGASPKQAEKILRDLIPFLMGNNGIQSKSEEVQSFSFDALLKMCKNGGDPLKPYVPSLIEDLLGLLSTFEPQVINYIALNANKYGLTSNDIDASRMASLRHSPLMEAIEQMIETLDDSLLEALIPKLIRVIKGSVGLPSKLGVGRIVVTLTIRNLQRIAPFAENMILACKPQLLDRNDTVSQSYATAVGYLARSASDKVLLDYIDTLKQLYFSSDDDRKRIIASSGVNGLSKHAPDRFSSIAVSLLPFVFVGKHDEDKVVQRAFEKCWSDNTGGSGAIALYGKEILDLAASHLTNPRWNIRQTAAISIAEVGNALKDSKSLDVNYVLDALVQALEGKSWKGKEKVLEALVFLSLKKKDVLLAEPDSVERLNSIVVKEAKRRNREYQKDALHSFGKYLSGFPFRSLYEIFFELCRAWFNPDDGEDEVERKPKADEEESNIPVLKGVLSSPSLTDVEGKDIGAYVVNEVRDLMVRALNNENFTWRTKLIVMECFSNLVKKVKDSSSLELSDLLIPFWNAIFKDCAYDINHEKIRLESINCGRAFLEILSGERRLDVLRQLKSLAETEKSSIVLTRLRKVLN